MIYSCNAYMYHYLYVGTCRIKRMRCGVCQNCLSKDCGKCKYCVDKPKFGGAGRLRQSCVAKKCQNMQIKGLKFFYLLYIYLKLCNILANTISTKMTNELPSTQKNQPQATAGQRKSSPILIDDEAVKAKTGIVMSLIAMLKIM